MKLFLYFSILYVLSAVGIVFLFRDNPIVLLTSVANTSGNILSVLTEVFAVFLAGAFLIFALFGMQTLKERSVEVGLAVAVCLILPAAFTLIKTSMPFITPFFADPFFASLDKALHFGTDPWELVHALPATVILDRLLPFYLSGWALPAFFLPIFIAATDGDADRRHRTMVLFVFSWVAIGNILAIAGMSAGPVFYDRLLGADRFALLVSELNASGVAASSVGATQEFLWAVHTAKAQAMGSGISAFPSVHLAIATVTAIYLAERSIWLLPVGISFVGAILLLSIYTGYHYALDGYFSIIVTIGLWVWLRKRQGDAAMRRTAAI